MLEVPPTAEAADENLTFVLLSADQPAFDESLPGSDTVADLVTRVRRRLGLGAEARVVLICAGALLQNSTQLAQAVRMQLLRGTKVHHVHYSVHLPQVRRVAAPPCTPPSTPPFTPPSTPPLTRDQGPSRAIQRALTAG